MVTDLRLPDPARTDVNVDSIVLADLVNGLKDIGDRLTVAEHTIEGSDYTRVMHACGHMKDLLTMFASRVELLRYQVSNRNNPSIFMVTQAQRREQRIARNKAKRELLLAQLSVSDEARKKLKEEREARRMKNIEENLRERIRKGWIKLPDVPPPAITDFPAQGTGK